MRIDELRPGLELGPSRWLDVPQARIDAFAEATDDRQWIHVDAERAAAGPFGATIAHGYLTLSLLVPISYELLAVEDASLVVNYGLDRVRFIAPVRSGKRIRDRFVLDSVEEKAPGQILVRHTVTVEIEGEERPALTAQWLGLLFI